LSQFHTYVLFEIIVGFLTRIEPWHILMENVDGATSMAQDALL